MKKIKLFKKRYDVETMEKTKVVAVERAKNYPRNYMFNLEYNDSKNVYLVKSKKNIEKMFAVENQFEDMSKKEIECFIANQYYDECIRYL